MDAFWKFHIPSSIFKVPRARKPALSIARNQSRPLAFQPNHPTKKKAAGSSDPGGFDIVSQKGCYPFSPMSGRTGSKRSMRFVSLIVIFSRRNIICFLLSGALRTLGLSRPVFRTLSSIAGEDNQSSVNTLLHNRFIIPGHIQKEGAPKSPLVVIPSFRLLCVSCFSSS